MTKTHHDSETHVKPKSYYEGSADPQICSSTIMRRLEKRRILTRTSQRLVVVMVGLPGRGKSFLGRKLQGFLTWRGNTCKAFNVGKYRREAHAAEEAAIHSSQREQVGACDANFFDTNNATAARLREEVAMLALKDMLKWLDFEEDGKAEKTPKQNNATTARSDWIDPQDNFTPEEYEVEIKGGSSPDSNDTGDGRRNKSKPKIRRAKKSSRSTSESQEVDHSRIAIFDATNSTKQRRDMILEVCKQHQLENNGPPVGIVFLESICDDEELLEENYRYKIRNSPDFEGMSEEEAMADIRERSRKYEERYETIDDDSLSYIKLFNFSSKILANNIYGRACKIILPALMSWHIGDRPVYLCRAGKTFSDEDFFGIGGMLEASSQVTFGTEFGTVTSGVLINELDLSTRSGNPSTVLDISQGRGNNRKAYLQMDTSNHRAQLALDVSSHVSAHSNPSTGNPTRDRTRTTRGTHLDEVGNRFRDAVSNYVAKEGHKFMQRRSHALKGLSTGTSITGSATVVTGINLDELDLTRSFSKSRSFGSNASFESYEKTDSDADGPLMPTFPCCVLSSTMPRAIQTATWQNLPFNVRHLSNLNPLDKGDFNGMEIDDLIEYEPDWYRSLTGDPFNTRFPGGECYRDVRDRLESVIIDIEQQVAPVVVVSHVSVLQVLLSYFRQTPTHECTQIEVPMHTIIKLTPLRGGGWNEIHEKLIEDDDDVVSDGSPEEFIADGGGKLKAPIWTDKRSARNSSLDKEYHRESSSISRSPPITF